jgi:uncharacterized protein (TIGR02246 family)
MRLPEVTGHPLPEVLAAGIIDPDMFHTGYAIMAARYEQLGVRRFDCAVAAACARRTDVTRRSCPASVHGQSMRPRRGRGRMVASGSEKGERMELSAEAMNDIPARMIDAWNREDAAGFFADFAEDATVVELEGTIFRNRAGMIAAQEATFATVMKGSRLVGGEVPFAQVVSPGVGVIHHRVGILMPGEEMPPPRSSMQLFVVVQQDGRWVVSVLQNARLLSMEALAALESPPAG